MRMRTPQALLALAVLASCEKEPPPAAAALPAPEQKVAVSLPPPEVIDEPHRIPEEAPAPPPSCQQPERRWKGIPVPPSAYPKPYTAWLDSLCDDDKQKIDTFCKRHPVDFEIICGGIGPQHIPYPPMIRARMWTNADGSRSEWPPNVVVPYKNYKTWHSSLTKPQLAYLAKWCPGGEDQSSSDLCGDNTPLVIAFANQPVEFVADGAYDWPTGETPWLVLDRDGNGTIDGEQELFGSSTVLADGNRSPNGFIALEELDANHDGTIDAADPAFAKLQLWADRDRDRHGTADELTAASARLVSISLANHVDLRCDARRNCEGERAAIVWRDGEGSHEGSVVDVYLPRR